MLGMAPDCVLVDLAAEETSPALAAMLRREAAAWWAGAYTRPLSGSKQRKRFLCDRGCM
jgi:hypothetical protein